MSDGHINSLEFLESSDGGFVFVSQTGNISLGSVTEDGSAITTRTVTTVGDSDVFPYDIYDHDKYLNVHGRFRGTEHTWFVNLTEGRVEAAFPNGENGIANRAGDAIQWSVLDIPADQRDGRVAALQARGVPVESGWFLRFKDSNRQRILVDAASKLRTLLPVGSSSVFWRTAAGNRLVTPVISNSRTGVALRGYEIVQLGLPGEPAGASVHVAAAVIDGDQRNTDDMAISYSLAAPGRLDGHDTIWGSARIGSRSAILSLTRIPPGTPNLGVPSSPQAQVSRRSTRARAGTADQYVERVVAFSQVFGEWGPGLAAVDPVRKFVYITVGSAGYEELVRVSLESGQSVSRRLDPIDTGHITSKFKMNPTTRAAVYLSGPDSQAILGRQIVQIADVDTWLDAR